MNVSERANADLIFVSPDLRPGIVPMLRGFADHDTLHRFITTIGYSTAGVGGRTVARIPFGIGPKARRLLGRREMPDFLRDKTETYPLRELVRTAISRWSGNDLLADRVWWWAERGFDRKVAKKWAGVAPFLYGFESASAETFREQKRRGGVCILGQLIAHHRTAIALFQEELEAYPDAATEYDHHLLRTADRVNALKDEQFTLSDLIVANSEFVYSSFVEAGIAPEKIIVIPGAGPGPPAVAPDIRIKDRMIFLSAGAQSLRKGTPYLLQAWRKVGAERGVELWMVGKNTLSARLMENLPDKTVSIQPVPQAELFKLYGQASVLVLPSLCEGFALVILEAMAHGLPIITTPNSGCGHFVEDGVNGWIVPIRDADALAERMTWCIENPDTTREMGRRSREKAAQWTWDDYTEVHTEKVISFMGSYR
jgi:glycosyltransferase involved in cell wall biosynthesis